MDFESITNEAKNVFCTLYKVYLNNRKDGLSISKSSYIGDSDYIQEKYFPDINLDDITDICWNLSSKGFLTCYPGDDLACGVSLTPDAIAFMQHKFSNDIKKLTSFIANLVF